MEHNPAEARQLRLRRENLYHYQALKQDRNHHNHPSEGYPMHSLKQRLQLRDIGECPNYPY